MKLGTMGVGSGEGARGDADLIRRAESLGFDSVWTAARTERIKADAVMIGAGQREASELLAETAL